MATFNLTAEELRAILDYNPETGVFTHRIARGYAKAGDVAGSLKPNGYVRVTIARKMYQAHRLAWLYLYGSWPANYIDHINGIRSDNRASNLRECTKHENCQNLKKPITNTSGLIGARFHKARGKWVAGITANYKRIHLGYFPSALEAHLAYLVAKSELHTFQPTIRPE